MHDEQPLAGVPGAVYVCDTDGVVVRYDRRGGELWGRHPVPGAPKDLKCGSHRLDGDLMPHDEIPIADILSDRGVRVVSAGGYTEQGSERRHAGLPALQKPFTLDRLARTPESVRPSLKRSFNSSL